LGEREDMGFGLFILVNLTLFIRPGEVIPDLEGAPIYLVLILSCLVVSWPRVLQTLSRIREQPISLCVLGLWVAAILSHLSKGDTFSARQVAESFGRVVVYYLLLVSLIDSPARMRQFLGWILGAIVLTAALAVLLYHGLVTLPGLKVLEQRGFDNETGEETFTPRLCGSGIFNDPNDLCLALTMGTIIGLYGLCDKRLGMLRLVCAPVLVLFGYTLRLTQSRGGLLGLFVALLALCWVRFGWRKTVLAALVLVPVMLLLMGGRQTNFNLDGEDTGQERIKLWSEGLGLFRQSPLFGIGTGRYAEEVGLVAHNSFVHAFTEMGFVGGALFAGVFYLALWPLACLSLSPGESEDQELKALQPFVFALVMGFAAGLWSLSRNYIEVTYLALGIAQVHLSLISSQVSVPGWQQGLLKRVGWVGALALAGLDIVTRATVVWG
jgi:putative inorganic carbon (HCO3(-)) transporter